MTDQTTPRPAFLPRRIRLGAAAFALLAAGGVGGAIAGHSLHPPIEMAPLHAVTIASLPNAQGIVTVKGRVVETYGNKFVIDDGSGRTLIDTGHEGDERTLAANGAIVSVQGRYDRGALHPAFLVGPDGTVTALRPMGPPHGPHGPHGPQGGPDDMPPPPAPVAGPPPAPGTTAPASAAG